MINNIVQLDYYNYLNDKDYINLLSTNKELNKLLLDDNTYKFILQKKFSKIFIDKVKKYIISWKDCYIRIKNFENLILSKSLNLWCEKDYFAYWKFKYK